MTIVKANPRSTSPPKKYSADTAKNVVLLVISVTGAVMMATVSCVTAPGFEILDEFGLRAGGT